MPYEIRNIENEFCVYKLGSQSPLKCYPSKEQARRYFVALSAAMRRETKSVKHGSHDQSTHNPHKRTAAYFLGEEHAASRIKLSNQMQSMGGYVDQEVLGQHVYELGENFSNLPHDEQIKVVKFATEYKSLDILTAAALMGTQPELRETAIQAIIDNESSFSERNEQEVPTLLNIVKTCSLDYRTIAFTPDEVAHSIAYNLSSESNFNIPGRNILGASIYDAVGEIGPNKDVEQKTPYWSPDVIPPIPNPKVVDALQQTYEKTQKYFEKQGITEVPLFRGTPLNEGMNTEPWSTDNKTAVRFAQNAWVQTGEEIIPEVRVETIPVAYIWDSYKSQPRDYNFKEEKEYTVLGKGFYNSNNASRRKYEAVVIDGRLMYSADID